MNKRVAIILGIITIVIIGFGGKVYMDNKAEEKVKEEQRNLLKAERDSVIALKNTFVDIKAVNFKRTGYNNMTGSYNMLVEMTSKKDESVIFDFLFVPNEPDKIDGWGVVDEQGVQTEGQTHSLVDVTYSNDSKESV